MNHTSRRKFGLAKPIDKEETSQPIGSACFYAKNIKNKKKGQHYNWRIGDVCRAIYSQDGEAYEAEILVKIQEDRCVVKFIGYNNEEVVNLKDLQPSLGSQARKLQAEMAEKYETRVDTSESQSEVEVKLKPSIKSPKIAKYRYSQEFYPSKSQSIYDLSAPPSIHILSPSLDNSLLRNKSETDPRQKDEHLQSLLMAWYLCGYHTGYYSKATNS